MCYRLFYEQWTFYWQKLNDHFPLYTYWISSYFWIRQKNMFTVPDRCWLYSTTHTWHGIWRTAICSNYLAYLKHVFCHWHLEDSTWSTDGIRDFKHPMNVVYHSSFLGVASSGLKMLKCCRHGRLWQTDWLCRAAEESIQNGQTILIFVLFSQWHRANIKHDATNDLQ